MQNDLGMALDGEGRYKEAEEVVRQSLATAKLNKNSQEIDEHLAIIQCNLAVIQSHLGLFDLWPAREERRWREGGRGERDDERDEGWRLFVVEEEGRERERERERD